MARLLPAFIAAATLLIATESHAQNALNERLLLASPGAIAADAELSAHMTTLAETEITTHCATCHGADLSGQTGVPNLVDYDWLWSVTGMEMTSVEPVLEIMQTILYGVRDTSCPDEVKRYGGCPDTRYSEMPAYGELGFSRAQIDDLVEYVVDLAGGEADAAAVTRAGATAGLCVECHAEGGYGYKPYGGPDLTDAVWLYGSSRDEIRAVLVEGRKGTCPAWAEVLDAATIKALAVYLYNKSLG